MKRKYIIVGVIILLVLIIVLLVFVRFKSKDMTYDRFDKFSLAITVDMKKGEEVEDRFIDVSFDGENARISSNKIDKDSYIIGGRLYYLEEDTFYWYRVETSYLDIYEIISSYEKVSKVKEQNDVLYNEAQFSAETINALLDALYFNGSVSSEEKVTYAVVDKKVEEFNIVLSNVDGYDEVSINVLVAKLEDDYSVNTSRIFGTVGGGRRYKTSETSTNIFEFGL